MSCPNVPYFSDRLLRKAGAVAVPLNVLLKRARDRLPPRTKSLASRPRRPPTPARPPEHAEPENRHDMPIVVEGPAVPVHSIAFRASSLKQAQELARFAAPFDGTLSPARHPDRSAPAEPVRPRVPGPPPALRSPHLARIQIDLQPGACCEAGHGQREIIGIVRRPAPPVISRRGHAPWR